MEDGDDQYARDDDAEQEDQTAGVDEPIYEDDGNDSEHQIVDERDQDIGNQNDVTLDQDAVADDNDVDDHRRGRHQRITETVPDKDVNNLYITNLSFQTTDESLRAVFEPYGQITNCQVIKEPITQTSRGFGFVSFYTLEECEKALQAMNGGECDGRLIRVEKAKRNSGYSKTPGVYLGPPQLSSRFGDYKGRLPRDIDPRDFKQRSSTAAAESYPERSERSSLPPRQQYTSSHSDRSSYPASRDPYLSSGYGGYRGPPPGYGGRSPPSYRDGDRYDDRYDYNRIPRSSLPPARYDDSRDRRDHTHRGGGPPPSRDYPPYASSYDHRPLSSRRSRSPPPLHYDDRRPPPMSYSSTYYRDGPPPRSSRY